MAQSPIAQPPMAQPPMAQPSAAQPTAIQPPMAQPPMAQPPVAQPPVAQPPVAQPPMAQPPVAQPPVAQPPMPQPPVAQPPVAQPPVAQPPVAQPPVARPPMAQPPMAQPPVAQPPVARAAPAAAPLSAGDLPKPGRPSGVVPDPLFLHLMAQHGFLSDEVVAELQGRQRRLAAEGEPLRLFALAAANGLEVAVANRVQAAASSVLAKLPAPAAGLPFEGAVPDATFLSVAQREGLLAFDVLMQLQLNQRRMVASGEVYSLFDIARGNGLEPHLAERVLAAAPNAQPRFAPAAPAPSPPAATAPVAAPAAAASQAESAPAPARTPSGRAATRGLGKRSRTGRLAKGGTGRLGKGATGRLKSGTGRLERKKASPLPLIGLGLGAMALIGLAVVVATKRPAEPQVAQASPAPASSLPAAGGEVPSSPADDFFLPMAEEEIRRAEADRAAGKLRRAHDRLQRLRNQLRTEAGAEAALARLDEALGALPPPPKPEPSVAPSKAPEPAPSAKPKPRPSRAPDPDLPDLEVPDVPEDPYEDEEPEDPDLLPDFTPAGPPPGPGAPSPRPEDPGVVVAPRPSPEPKDPDRAAPPAPLGGGGAAPAKASVTRAAFLDPEFRERKAKLRDPDASDYAKLAKWCRRNDLYEEEKVALLLALEQDPEHRSAKSQLAKIREKESYHSDFRTPWRRDASVIFVLTNTDEAKLHYYCDSVSAFYKRFSRIFQARKNPVQMWGTKVGIRIYKDRTDFLRYSREMKDGASGAVGYYSLVRKEIILYYDKRDPQETLDTLFHEGTHLFTHLVLGEQFYKLPHWVSEGIAEYFAPSKLDRKKKDLRYGLPCYTRLRTALRIIEHQRPSLKGDLLDVRDYGSFGAARYSLAWSLIHMLIEKTKPGSKRPIYRDGFLRYFSATARGEDWVKAFEKYIGPIDRLEDEWYDYVREFPLPAIEEARALVRKGDIAESIPHYERHVQAEPKDALGAYELGEALVQVERYADSVPHFERAVALNPDLADAWASLAWSLLMTEESRRCLEPAQRAVKLEPTGYNQFVLATAAYEAGDKAVARLAIRRAVELSGQSALIVELKRKIDAM